MTVKCNQDAEMIVTEVFSVYGLLQINQMCSSCSSVKLNTSGCQLNIFLIIINYTVYSLKVLFQRFSFVVIKQYATHTEHVKHGYCKKEEQII